mmetsp:Transcript_24101/g.48189  ORF Transcript_24101/g.48189 Transcript_24101/m.48189 type:complete len:104 (+) Transcript_24101:1709-2020(+)
MSLICECRHSRYCGRVVALILWLSIDTFKVIRVWESGGRRIGVEVGGNKEAELVGGAPPTDHTAWCHQLVRAAAPRSSHQLHVVTAHTYEGLRPTKELHRVGV